MSATSKRVKCSGARPANQGQKWSKQRGLQHNWYKNRYNTKNHTNHNNYKTVTYALNVSPAIEIELNKPVYIDANMSEYERFSTLVLNMSNSQCFDL